MAFCWLLAQLGGEQALLQSSLEVVSGQAVLRQPGVGVGRRVQAGAAAVGVRGLLQL
jgi:hypothetical protein